MYDVAIIGAGVIGCSIARELSKYELKICVLEKASDIAAGTTKANSAIVHAGFDANPDSIKGKLNAKGNAMFDRLSEELDFPFKRIGAFVLCFDEKNLYKLEELKKQGETNGVPGLVILNKEEIKKLEPNISEDAVAALYAPSSGIVCPYEMTIALAENANCNGVEFKFETEVKNIKKNDRGYLINTSNGEIEAALIINAAGVYADEINNMVSNKKLNIVPRKGQYLLFDKEAGNLVSRTIFQLPTAMGKGVLVTPTVDGNLLLGPNASDIEDKNNLITSKEGMDEIVSKGKLSVKALPLNKVITSFSGLRAHSEADDFIIGEAYDAENFINAAGIESPGLSSAPSIGLMIENIIAQKLKPKKNENFNPIRKGIPKFRELSNEERNKLIKERPEYGKIVCRCEVVTEGEIIDSIRRPLGARSLDGVKRRTRAGMGRCQAGFCSAKIVDILAKELNIVPTEVTKFGGDSKVLIEKNKESFV
ncbi:NAD(P)/FAD-dependent oxidoreductase [Clostridium sp. YIM B02515]|uniref:NAD(P)/FAD-dependent oxidoreductase n=1 Tax=Clostridium rhizosphaerae TaxID=2803861 RepID=A0ABS1TE94_9CLOT|nr:NAD(P)/FAD-dependent oxidoreductase [Clostridium rhizosphaerae]MBL4937392.1 NAD(P)/FAD-dependent oxidoreductase [Clostridium rhizosphaerae]